MVTAIRRILSPGRQVIHDYSWADLAKRYIQAVFQNVPQPHGKVGFMGPGSRGERICFKCIYKLANIHLAIAVLKLLGQ